MSLLSVLKNRKTSRPLVYLLVFGVLMLTVFNLYKLPKSASAGVSVSGNEVKISGGNFVIDDDGKIYKEPSYNLREKHANGSLYNVDREYYAYLFDDTGTAVSSATNLTIENSATVMMEGTQELANLTVKGKLNQPYPDREGKINKPIYTADYWMGRFTGFLKLDANTRYYLYTDGVDDFTAFEVGSGTVINNSTSWTVVYRHSGVGEVSGWNYKNLNLAQYKLAGNSTVVAMLDNNTSSTKYVPIRVSFADRTGAAYLSVNYLKFNTGSWTAKSGDYSERIKRSDFCGINDDGTVAAVSSGSSLVCEKESGVNFDYFVSKDESVIEFDTSNAVRTAGKKDFNLKNDFSGGFGDHYGDNNEALFGDRMIFYWTATHTPYGRTASYHSQKRASRYSGLEFNAKAYDAVRRIPGGLTLNVSGDTKIEGSGIIDLNGKGYPGYSVEMGGSSGTWGRIRGGSVGFDGSPGGGYSNAVDCDGAGGNGGSHGGQGGYNSGGGNHCRIDKRPDTYDNKYNPSYMGSGGGASNDDSWANIAGSGGGLLKLTTRNLTISSNKAIDASGDGGEYVLWHSTAGGAGGSVNINVNGKLTVSSSSETILAKGSDGVPRLTTDYFNRHIAGGGGMVYIAYSSSNLERDQLLTRVSADGGDGGGWNCGWDFSRLPWVYRCSPEYTMGGEEIDGTDGTVEFANASVSTEVVSITKQSFDKDGKREATFEAGDRVTVEIRVSEPGTVDRDDFKIEDYLPKNSGTVALTLKKSDGSTVTPINRSIGADGKVTLEGDSNRGIVLKPGVNIISYTYTL